MKSIRDARAMWRASILGTAMKHKIGKKARFLFRVSRRTFIESMRRSAARMMGSRK